MFAVPPYRKVSIAPAWEVVARLSGNCGLRGADLWHLCTAVTLREKYLPQISVLTFDSKLKAAASELNLVQ